MERPERLSDPRFKAFVDAAIHLAEHFLDTNRFTAYKTVVDTVYNDVHSGRSAGDTYKSLLPVLSCFDKTVVRVVEVLQNYPDSVLECVVGTLRLFVPPEKLLTTLAFRLRSRKCYDAELSVLLYVLKISEYAAKPYVMDKVAEAAFKTKKKKLALEFSERAVLESTVQLKGCEQVCFVDRYARLNLLIGDVCLGLRLLEQVISALETASSPLELFRQGRALYLTGETAKSHKVLWKALHLLQTSCRSEDVQLLCKVAFYVAVTSIQMKDKATAQLLLEMITSKLPSRSRVRARAARYTALLQNLGVGVKVLR